MESIAKKLRKSLASLTLVAMGFSFLAAPAAQARLDFTDSMEIPSWAEEAIEELMDQGVISGNDDGSFAPNRQLNRAEVSKVIVLASGVEIDTTGGPHFPDVKDGAWYYDYIETMYNQGWINGYPDGYFRPAVGINRAEIAKMAINAFEIDQDLSGAPHFDDVSASDWFYGYVETAYNNGLMRGYGDGSFGPANAVTRAETVKIVYDSQLVVAEPMGPAEGTLEVALSYDTPRGTNVPYNATSVPYTTVELTASDDSDVEISSLTFTRLGLGDNDDFDNVWLEIDGFKIGNDKSINNDDIVELRFNPPIVVPAGQTLVADVVTSAKYSSDDKNIGHHNRIALVSPDDVVTTAANIVGDFPIEGEEMEVADYEVSSIQFTTLGSDTNIDVGDNFIEIGKFRVLSSTASNKDIEVRAITFKNDGTAEIEDALENVALYVSGEQVSAETIIDGDYVTFRLDNGVTGGYIIEDGDSKIFSIRADVVSAERSDTIQFKIDNYEDIVGVEIGTSFGIKAVYGGGASSDASCTSGTSNAEDECASLRTYSIDSGDLNISRDPASIGNQTYSPGSNDVVFLTARVVVDQPLIIDGLRVDVADSSAITNRTELNTNFDNFRFYLNDRLVDSENDFSAGTTDTTDNSYLNFNTTFEIAGTSIIKIVGNVSSEADDADKLKLEILGNSSTLDAFFSPEYISTGDQVSDSQVLGSAQGSFVEIQSSTLSVTRTDGLTDGDKIVAGVDDVEFLKVVLDNNDSGDVNVTSLSIVGIGTGKSRTYTNYTAAVFVDGTQQGSAKNLSSTDGSATFNDLSVVIPSAGQKEFVIVVDTIEAAATATSETLSTNAVNATGSTQIEVTNSFKDELTVGDTIILSDGTTEEEREVSALGADDSGASGSGYADVDITVATATNFNGGSSTVELKHTMLLYLSAVDADNVDNGDPVTTNRSGSTLAATGTDETSVGYDGNCDGDTADTSTTNYLCGASFELVQSGRVTVSKGEPVYSDILVAGSSNVEVMKVQFNAADDEVQVKDLFMINDIGDDDAVSASEKTFGDRVTFKLFNESGQLVQEKQMTSGELHFELGNQDRIRVPKDDSTFVTIKVDVRDITKSNQTGERLQLGLDVASTPVISENTTNGVEAVTAATGADLAASAISGDADGEVFVAYRSEISINHATTQPSYSIPSSAKPVYNFTVTADSAYDVELAELTFLVSLSGGLQEDGGDANLAASNFSVVRLDSNFNELTSGADTGITEAVIADATEQTASTTAAVLAVTFSTPEQIARGTSKNFQLQMSGLESASGNDSVDQVAVQILSDSSYDAPDTMSNQTNTNAAQATRGNDLVWSDKSDTAHSTTTSDWLNGYLVTVGQSSAGMKER